MDEITRDEELHRLDRTTRHSQGATGGNGGVRWGGPQRGQHLFRELLELPRGQQRDRVQPRAGQRRVTGPYRVEPGPLGPHREVHQPGRVVPPGHRGLPGREQDPDPERALGRSGGLGTLCTHTPMLTAAHAGVDYL